MSFLHTFPAAPSEQAQNALKFGDRIRQQLEEKKQRVKTLSDAENLLEDEQKFCKLMKTSIDRLSEADQWHCVGVRADLTLLAIDQFVVERYTKIFIKARTENLRNLYKIEKFEASLKPRPELRVETVSFYLDGELDVRLSEEAPEKRYRVQQAALYFAKLLVSHCNLVDPEDTELPGIYPGADGRRYTFTVKPMGIYWLEIDTIARRRIITRCPSRDFIFNPERTFYQEYERIVRQFIEESFANPRDFKPAEHLTVVPTKDELRAVLPSDHELVAEPASEVEEPEVEEPEVGLPDVD